MIDGIGVQFLTSPAGQLLANRECSVCLRRTRRMRVAEQQGVKGLGSRVVVCVVVVLSGTSCTPTQSSPAAAQRAALTTDFDAPPRDLPPARLEPIPVDGDCSAGPPMGKIGAYAATSVELTKTDSGSVRVWSCAVWPALDQRNVIGSLDDGLVAPAFGPVKHGFEKWATTPPLSRSSSVRRRTRRCHALAVASRAAPAPPFLPHAPPLQPCGTPAPAPDR